MFNEQRDSGLDGRAATPATWLFLDGAADDGQPWGNVCLRRLARLLALRTALEGPPAPPVSARSLVRRAISSTYQGYCLHDIGAQVARRLSRHSLPARKASRLDPIDALRHE